MRPKIGITTSFESLNDSSGEQRLRLEYVEAVVAAGGTPLIVPMSQDADALDELSALLDGLIMTGGPSVTHELIGELPDDLSKNSETRRKADLALLRRILDQQKPFLGICYGMQQLNAVFGGTIYADVERAEAFTTDHLSSLPSGNRGPATQERMTHSQKRGATTHDALLVPDTHFRSIMNTDKVTVNTRHLQAVAQLGRGLRVSAVAPDGVIEGLEDESGLLLGVQFHPERDLDQFLPLFEHFTQLAANQAKPDEFATSHLSQLH